MANQYMSMDNLRFLLHEVFDLEGILKYKRYEDYDKESADMMIDAAKDLADKELFPYFVAMDEDPVRYENGEIIAHPQLKKIIEEIAAAGWIGATMDYEDGGMQMPITMYCAASHIFQSANNGVVGYTGLTSAAANLILSFGSQALKDTYVPNMLNGKWGGTMCLTEPQAGSSLSDITTSAAPQADGSYKIKGQKIFISGGDHQFAENFVHLTIARIEGAPEGVKGISLFVVPKHRPTENGTLTPNDVITAGDFQKLGQRSFATAHLVFGENDACHGYLIGAENQGLKYMFQMMNGARIGVGLGAISMATAAYYASLQYAQERPQGRRISMSLGKDAHKPQIPIIEHADVRRMLLLQKAITEGALSLIFESTVLHDLERVKEGKESEEEHLLLELLTPIVKTYPSEYGRLAINNGLQILGGYGFCMDFPLQQYYRDIRIMALYEGTTGIQSLDLLGRKVVMKNGKAMKILIKRIQATIESAETFDELKPYVTVLKSKTAEIQKVLMHLIGFAMKGDAERFLMDATLFMEMMSIVVVGWQWLKQGVAAKQALVTGKLVQSEVFYESKLHTMQFYYRYEMPKTLGLGVTIMDKMALTIAKEKELFV